MNRFRERLNQEKIFTIIKIWLPMGVVITLLSGLMYLLVQQTIRLSANSSPVQLATDIALEIKAAGISPTLTSLPHIEIIESISPYALIYDNEGKLLASSAVINGNTPSIPQGILEYAKKTGEDRVTWQPQTGVRQALVAVYHSGTNPGYVVVGKSLREAEKLIDSLTLVCLLGGVFTLTTSLILTIFVQFIF